MVGSKANSALIGMLGSWHLVDLPESDLMVAHPPPGVLTRSPTLADSPTQLFPSAPVIESLTALTTLPGM